MGMLSWIPTALAASAATPVRETGANVLAPEIRTLVVLCGVVDVFVVAVLAAIVLHQRRRAAPDVPPPPDAAVRRRLLLAGLLLPLMAISVVMMLSVRSVTASAADDRDRRQQVDRSAVVGIPQPVRRAVAGGRAAVHPLAGVSPVEAGDRPPS